MNLIRDYRSDEATLATFEMLQAMTNAEVGDEVLVSEESHIYNMETGGLAALAGVQTRPIRSKGGQFDLQELQKAIRKGGLQFPITKVLCLENTYDLNRGIPLSEEYMSEASLLAHKNHLSVYLDGARIFNAATALKVEPKILCKDIDRIPDDHLNAKRLAIELANLNENIVSVEKTLTNIVLIDLKSVGVDAYYMANILEENDIKVKVIDSTTCRFVTHRNITAEDIEETINVIKHILI